MAKIIRPNLVNTVRSSEISAILRWGALFAVLLAGAVGLLLAKQYLPAAVCILILPIALPLAKKQIGVIRAGADGEARDPPPAPEAAGGLDGDSRCGH